MQNSHYIFSYQLAGGAANLPKLLLLGFILLSGSSCGQKGDLYIPERESSVGASYYGMANVGENGYLIKT